MEHEVRNAVRFESYQDFVNQVDRLIDANRVRREAAMYERLMKITAIGTWFVVGYMLLETVFHR